MQILRIVAGVLVLSLICGLAFGQWRKKKKKDEEDVTQTLPLLKDPPAAAIADIDRLVFRVSPLSNKGLLSPQVRDALKWLIESNRGAGIVKLRAFVAGTGDVRRVQTLVSEIFTDKHLPLPALTVVLGGGLPLEGAQVVIESAAVDKKVVNPHGLAFLSGRAGDSAAQSIQELNGSLAEAGLTGSNVLRATCFVSVLDGANNTRASLASAFPKAALNIVQMQRVPVRPAYECEAIAALDAPVQGDVQSRVGMVRVGPSRVVMTGLQMAFNSEESDIRLALERLGKTLEAQGSSYAGVVSGNIYLLSGEADAAFQKLRGEFLQNPNTPALTVLSFEGLPSPDATFGMDLIAVVRK